MEQLLISGGEAEEAAPDPAKDLVGSLHSLRDGLVHLSLLLQDMQFHMDTDERSAAVAQVNALMKKINSG